LNNLQNSICSGAAESAAASAFSAGDAERRGLHNHLSGAVYAESWIRAAAEDHLCVDVAKLAFVKAVGTSEGGLEPACGEGKVPAANAYKDQHLFDALVMLFPCADSCLHPGDGARSFF